MTSRTSAVPCIGCSQCDDVDSRNSGAKLRACLRREFPSLEQSRPKGPSGPHAREVQPRWAHSRKLSAHPRVLIVSPQPFYEDRGTPIAVVQVAAALSALDCEVDVLAYPVGRPVSIRNMRLYRSGNPLGIRRVRIGFSLEKVILDLGMLGRLPGCCGPADMTSFMCSRRWPSRSFFFAGERRFRSFTTCNPACQIN